MNTPKNLSPFFAFACCSLLTLAVRAQEADVPPDKEIVAEQYLLAGSATRGSGESQVAVNPLNPNQIAVAAMGVLNTNEGTFEHVEFNFRRTPRAVLIKYLITRDRGLTWSEMEDPMREYFHRYRMLDPFVEFANDGTMILGGEAHFDVNGDAAQQIDEAAHGGVGNSGGVDIILSTDGGHTFSQPIEVFSASMPKEILGPNVALAADSAPGDAPKLKIDRSTGKLHMIGFINGENPKRPALIVRTSNDRGRSWGMVYAADNPEWLGGGRGSHDVANGVLAVCYPAAKVPAEFNIKVPCLVLATSKDDGKTFDRHPVPGTSDNSRGSVFADPSKPGHYVILSEAANQIVAFLTEDSGATWASPQTVAKGTGTAIANLAATFNDRGELGVSWRAVIHDPKSPVVRRGFGGADKPHVFATDPDTSEIWSALSRDGAKTFTAPLKVSTAPSPGVSRRRGNQNHGYDYNGAAMDHDFLHLTWYDSRAGFVGTWYGRVPLKDYK